MTVAFPPKVRAAIYWAAFVIGLALGATQVGYSAADAGQPVWLTVALAVFAFLAAGLGITAATNTPVTAPRKYTAGGWTGGSDGPDAAA